MMVLHWNGKQAMGELTQAGVRGLNKGAAFLLGQSNSLVPVDSTDLRKSGAVREANAANLKAEVVYNEPYAIEQHERTDYNHPTDHNPNAQAKYLETPLKEEEDTILGIVAAEIRRATK